MSTHDELPEDSDSSDEDYVPQKPTEAVSEEESDAAVSDHLSETEEDTTKRKRPGKSKRSKKKMKTTPNESLQVEEKPKELTPDEKKKLEDDIWADFMKDTGFQSKKGGEVSNKPKPQPTKSICEKPATEKVKITKVFEFAGEEVAVEEEVAADSAEARLFKSAPESTKSNANKSKGLSGIGSVLSQLGKKPKISTLEKSKLDWDKFKKEENLEEELVTYNRGKDGYLERQDFLQRADLRRFEIEKEIRTVERNKRLNNSM